MSEKMRELIAELEALRTVYGMMDMEDSGATAKRYVRGRIAELEALSLPEREAREAEIRLDEARWWRGKTDGIHPRDCLCSLCKRLAELASQTVQPAPGAGDEAKQFAEKLWAYLGILWQQDSYSRFEKYAMRFYAEWQSLRSASPVGARCDHPMCYARKLCVATYKSQTYLDGVFICNRDSGHAGKHRGSWSSGETCEWSDDDAAQLAASKINSILAERHPVLRDEGLLNDMRQVISSAFVEWAGASPVAEGKP